MGETSQVQVGVGTSSSGTNSAGLGVDIKQKKTVTVAIHAVTQHYTQAVAPPSPSGGWTPNQVCVTATDGVLWSTLGGDDQQSGMTINTGANGVCETTADPHDRQVIPVGWGIPKDIVPQNAPSASALQTYLNQIFGTQANVYFTVTRSDFSCDYDEYPQDGTMEAYSPQGFTSKEENVIYSNQDTTADYNVFYVQNFVALGPGNGGLVPDYNTIGITHYTKKVTVIRDAAGSSILNTSAHEIGHLLDLAHTDKSTLPGGGPNPAYTGTLPDPSPSDRLMYPYTSGSNILLIQPEWDIVNPNTPKQ